MPSSFGKRKPAVRRSVQLQPLQWLIGTKPCGADSTAAQETQEALYRITLSTPSRLSIARSMRAQHRTAA